MLFCNFSYDNSQDNSYIEKIDYIDFTRMSNTFNNTIKNQVENNHGKFHIFKMKNINAYLFF